MVILAVGDTARYERLARLTGLPAVEQVPSDSYYLTYEEETLVVRDPRQGKNFLLQIQIESQIQRILEQRIGYKKDLLCRAVGFKGDKPYKVFDGTLGFGKDSFHLMSFGCSIIGCEQNPIAFALMEDAIRCEQISQDRLSIVLGDSFDQLESFKDQVDCVYLDPMFENIKKKSAPKKQMAFLREINPEPGDVQRVIERGIELGIKRIVVKRPINGEHLYRKPNVTFDGKLVRYDVYTR